MIRAAFRRHFFLVILVVGVARVGASEVTRAADEDWPEFRGPTGQGIAQTAPTRAEWDLSRDVRWRQPIPGKGWSSPIVWHDRVYLTSAVPEADAATSLSLRALSLSAATGEVIWNVEVFRKTLAADEKVHKKNSFASPTPLTDGQRLYVHFGVDGTAALDLDGRPLWTNRELRFNPQHGGGGSPIFSGPLLMFHCDGAAQPFVAALNRDDGRLAWRVPRPVIEHSQLYSFATPLEIEVDGARLIVSPASHVVCAYDATSGEERWRVDYPNKWSIIPRPIYAHGLVFVCTGYDGPARLLAIDPTGRGNVTSTHIKWETDDQVSHTPSLLAVGDELYMVSDNGVASCRDVRTGELHWRHRLGGDYSASPIYADGKVYFQSEQGMCTVIAASRTYQELAKNDFGETVFASYALAHESLFVRTESQLYCIPAQP